MATPYVQKVHLGNMASAYHSGETVFECNKAVKSTFNCLQCNIEYASCPACDQQRGVKCVRRRSKSEGIEADPLREHNRLQETSYDVQHWKRKIVREYDSHNRICRQDPCRNDVNEELYSRSEPFIQPMEIDMGIEHKFPPNRILSPVKKFRERLLPTNHHNLKTHDHSRLTHNTLIQQLGENARQLDEACDTYDPSLGRVRPVPNSSQRKPSKAHCRKNFPSNNQPWGDGAHNNFVYSPSETFSVSGNRYNSSPLKQNVARNESPVFDDDFYSRLPFQEVPSDVRDTYLRDVEAIRSKLRELRGSTDGKRMRQRSESEPGVGNGGIPAGSSWEPKRARDISPKLPECNGHVRMGECTSRRKMSSSLSDPVCSYLPSQNHPCHRREAKLPCIPLQPSCDDFSRTLQLHSSDRSISLDSSLHNNYSGEDGDSKGEPAEDSEEDTRSAVSSLTTVSTDSNTPSVVGESLGSISLNDTSSKRIIKVEAVTTTEPCNQSQALRTSLFSYVPPYIRFCMHDEKGEPLPYEIGRHMKWKLSTITPLVVRRTLVNSGFRLVRSEFSRESNDWCGTWGKHMKSFCFKTLKDFQKVNHFPGTFQIGRKDRLWKNLYRLMTKFGKKEFGFIPRTYVLPQDSKMLRQAWEKNCGKEKWIIKPPASARGTGIKVIHRWAQIPKRRPLVVQKYISQPYLINGSKFDLRLYVLVTSINPLRIYIYDDGLVRFASVKYSGDMACLSDRYMHLTNYSINKMSSQYTQNEDASACQGHKWTVKTLWSYLEKDGVDVKALWDSLVDLVIKTIISGESSISQLTRANLVSRYCSYELFGIDVLLDEALKPWLLEVNISPSLHSSSPLDLAVKGPMVCDLMNMAGYQIPNKLHSSLQEELLNRFGLKGRVTNLCFDKRLYTTVLSKEERAKHNHHLQNSTRQEYLEDILQDLTPDDVRHLIQSEDELTQAGRFIRIFPTPYTYTYHEFFESPRYYNMVFDAWENKYYSNRQEGIDVLESLCRKKIHLAVPVPTPGAKFSVNHLNPQAHSPNTLSLKGAHNLQSCQEAFEEATESRPTPERKVLSLSSVALHRAARPRSGKLGVVLKPFPRSGYIVRKPKSSTTLSELQTSSDDANTECDSYDDEMKIPANNERHINDSKLCSSICIQDS
ncbi:tubulin monoglutamylase TTLL4-like isoform X1 [Schistocerca serialis cubense]|uniref:tubulin monoglutamylase TTLL4-like isoform X1 n=1 Tax=Schistocerca serialis cubense TaxID=2023355 RepID=UPI00214F2086|nr:tubulin monoglutamylase TTLL4-like isoform X1 [Schistocerca serialis cubense]XP_049950815.1 tubulin monoglutamylase TTLL4-like isoform X1 [Schistocerca serialis cubense]XP_049950816.1 tubulin monoglutamylase TTLL4-like isoform X1 [Schistocerca serialis cubense]XP_049950817.1 tubulin monoglutamylase TTLL4-like isoform X1 [Schistocerca serialis cubense]